jgi:proteasome lid subunit RPN8/RPN11
MSGFQAIKKINLPLPCLAKAYAHMREKGKFCLEGVALFLGKEQGDCFQVLEVLIPKQEAYALEQGLLYAVGGEELHHLNVYLYENKLSLIAQIHSHPGKAYHSDTDDAFPIMTTVGGISIVVPNFASRPITVDSWAVYRLSKQNQWMELSEVEKNDLLTIKGD